MADLIIKGMEMPRRCHDCELCARANLKYGAEYCCQALRQIVGNTHERMPNCPLVPLPAKHGRLIDADAIWKNMTADQSAAFQKGLAGDIELFEILEAAHAIIEAEGGGEDGN